MQVERSKSMAEDFDIKKVLTGALISKGAMAGTIATVPMTLFMLLIQRILPAWQHYDLPPEEITDDIAKRAGVEKQLSKPQRLGAALAAHFGFGASMGAFYPSLAKRVSWPGIYKGTIFGLGVWVVSYLGWLPALKMSAAAPEEHGSRNLMMIAAHVIWGATLGILTDVFDTKK